MIDELEHIATLFESSEKNNYVFVPSTIRDEKHCKEIQNIIDKE